MPYKIISPTGVFVTKTLDEATVNKLKAIGYFTLVPLRVHKRVLEECESCSS
jgi:hypothetical protein